ncbi:ABC transporter permease [Mycolicibacterium thermoresistibile]
MTTQSAPPNHQPHAPRHEPPAAVRATGIVVALTAAIAIIAIAFALPASRSAPHDVPIGVAAPAPIAEQISARLAEQAPGAFDIRTFDNDAALRAAIRDRQVYGGLMLGAGAPTLLIATGGSPAVAQLLTQIGSGLAEQTGATLRTEDLAPPTSDDPRGVGLAASALPITLAGLLPGIALVLALRREVWARFIATVVFAAVAGWTIALLLRFVFGSIDDNFWGVTAGLTLGILAAALTILGLGSLFGRAGLAIGALLAVLVGNPLSGLNAAPELLPRGWGELGQLLPQGANATLLRSTAYFSGAGASTAIVVLICWALAGTALVILAALRQRRTS